MVKVVEKTFPVTPVGVGRKDYSTNVEFAVEPSIRSYQSFYSYNTEEAVAGGGETTIDISVPAGYVVVLHDFVASVPANVLIGLTILAIEGIVISPVIGATKYQIISEHRYQGFPAFETIRITLHNYGPLALTFILTLTGFQLTRQQYYQEL